MRVVLPDIELAVRAYKNNDRDFFLYFKLPKVISALNSEIPLHQILLYVFSIPLSSICPQSEYHLDISKSEFDFILYNNPLEEALNHFTKQINLGNQENYPGNHINWFAHEKIIKMMNNSRFKDINISGFGQSQCPVLRDTKYFDKQKMQKISLFIEAKKTEVILLWRAKVVDHII